MLVSQWFLTLFSYSLRPPMLLRVLDLTFTDGWKAMFRFGLARLRSVEVRGEERGERRGERRVERGEREEGKGQRREGRGECACLLWAEQRVFSVLGSRGMEDAAGGGGRFGLLRLRSVEVR